MKKKFKRILSILLILGICLGTYFVSDSLYSAKNTKGKEYKDDSELLAAEGSWTFYANGGSPYIKWNAVASNKGIYSVSFDCASSKGITVKAELRAKTYSKTNGKLEYTTQALSGTYRFSETTFPADNYVNCHLVVDRANTAINSKIDYKNITLVYNPSCYKCTSSTITSYHWSKATDNANIATRCEKVELTEKECVAQGSSSTDTIENVGQERCVISGSMAGQKIHIISCTGQICDYSKSASAPKSGTINRNNLAPTTNPACAGSGTTATPGIGKTGVDVSTPTPKTRDTIDSTTDTWQGYRYAQEGANNTGDYVACGDKIHVLSCTPGRTDTDTCEIDEINGIKLTTYTEDGVTRSYTTVKRQKIGTDQATCPKNTRFVVEGKTYTNPEMTEGATDIACGTEVELAGVASEVCVGDNDTGYCKAKVADKEVYIPRGLFRNAKPDCAALCKDSDVQKEVKGTVDVKICYEFKNGVEVEGSKTTKELVQCAAGFNPTGVTQKENECNTGDNANKNDKKCSITYTVNCTSGTKPRIAAAGGVVTQGSLDGVISFNGIKTEAEIVGFDVDECKTPAASDDVWTEFKNQKYEDTVKKTAGLWCAWVKDANGLVSDGIMVRMSDTDITTTLKDITLLSESGNETYSFKKIGGEATAYVDNGVTDSGYVQLSNRLKNGTVLADGFDPLDHGYEVNVTANKIGVYATLTSDDSSYVDGFGPRTVDLEYGKNTILIKIINKKGKERTYTIIANRVDDRESNNLLSDLTVSAGTIKFDKYVGDYDIEVPKNTKEVTINGTLASENASFVKGYEPRKVTLDQEISSAVVKTISQAGIVRSYVLTFKKTGASTNTNYSDSVYLSSLSVSGTQLEFDKKKVSYSVSIPYERENINVFAFAESAKANVKVSETNGLVPGTNLIEVTVENGSKTKVYTLYVNRKEDGLNVASDTTLSTLTVKDYNIDFKPEVLDYVVKIKQEKTLLITATPNSNRSEVYMLGNNDLTGFSTVRIKVIAEDGSTETYSIDIKKDAYNKALEITAAVVGGVIIIGAGIIIVIKKKRRKMKDYIGE